MALVMRVNGMEICLMDKVFMFGQMGENMRGNGRITWCTEKESSPAAMEDHTAVFI